MNSPPAGTPCDPIIYIPDAKTPKARKVAPHARTEVPPAEPPRTIEQFWQLIASLNWTNKSDGMPNIRAVRVMIGRMSCSYQAWFISVYTKLYDEMFDILIADNMFARNNIDDADIPRIVSHSIALGRDQYATLREDMSLYQYLITADECASLDGLIR